MLRMMNRRRFGQFGAAALLARAVTPGKLAGELLRDSEEGGPQFSVMMWTLNARGSFEENLERVAQAGYGHVELVGEFKKWTEEETRRILARMHALKISVDAMSGMTLGFADPSGGDAFITELKKLVPVAKG